MKYFIVYKQPEGSQHPWKEVYTIDELDSVPGTSRLDELDAVKNGELSLSRETERHRIFNFICDAKIRRREKTIFAEQKSELWQQQNGRIVATMDATKYASRCAVAIAAYLTFKDPFAIRPVNLTKSDFLRFSDFIVEKKGGEATQVLLSDVENPELEFKMRSIYLKGSHLERIPSFNEYLKNSQKIRTIGFAIPNWEGRRLSFRITHWGGGQIFTPIDLFDHEIAAFLELLSQLIVST
jgi:hypothetical protein